MSDVYDSLVAESSLTLLDMPDKPASYYPYWRKLIDGKKRDMHFITFNPLTETPPSVDDINVFCIDCKATMMSSRFMSTVLPNSRVWAVCDEEGAWVHAPDNVCKVQGDARQELIELGVRFHCIMLDTCGHFDANLVRAAATALLGGGLLQTTFYCLRQTRNSVDVTRRHEACLGRGFRLLRKVYHKSDGVAVHWWRKQALCDIKRTHSTTLLQDMDADGLSSDARREVAEFFAYIKDVDDTRPFAQDVTAKRNRWLGLSIPHLLQAMARQRDVSPFDLACLHQSSKLFDFLQQNLDTKQPSTNRDQTPMFTEDVVLGDGMIKLTRAEDVIVFGSTQRETMAAKTRERMMHVMQNCWANGRPPNPLPKKRKIVVDEVDSEEEGDDFDKAEQMAQCAVTYLFRGLKKMRSQHASEYESTLDICEMPVCHQIA